MSYGIFDHPKHIICPWNFPVDGGNTLYLWTAWQGPRGWLTFGDRTIAGKSDVLALLADSIPSVLLVPLKISEDDKHVLQVAIYINEIGIRGSSESKEF